MRALLDYLKALYTWTKWTLQSLFLPKETTERDSERPGSDDQFHTWVREEWNRDNGLATDQERLAADQAKLAEDFKAGLNKLIPQTKVTPEGRLLFLCDRCNDYCDREEDEMEAVSSEEGYLVMVCGMCRKGIEDD